MNYLQTIQNDINKGNIAPVYLFIGPETYLADRVLDLIGKKALTPGMEALNFSSYDDKNIDFSEVIASCETLPVMSAKRIVVLGEQSAALSTTDPTALERFEGYLKNPSPSTILIVRDMKPDKRRRIFRLFSSNGKVLDFKKLDYAGVAGWIDSEVSSRGAAIDKGAKALLIERSHYLENEEMDTRTLGNEIERLIDYAGAGGKIDKAAVREVIPEGVEDNVYKIIDAAVNGRLRNIHEILESFWERGESPIGVFSLLLYQVRNIIKVAVLLNRGCSQKTIANETKMPAYVVRKTIPIARKYSVRRLLEIMADAADLDLKVKTGQIEPDFALEYFILKLNKTA